MAILDVQHIEKHFGDTSVLKDISFSLEEGQALSIIGSSGSGKTTVLNMLGGMDHLDAGSITIDGQEITKLSRKALGEYRRKKIGVVFQSYNLIPELTVRENIRVVEDISQNPLSLSELLEKLGLTDHATHFPPELSGGQQQRCAIARALIKNPVLLLCDEPTGALDSVSSREVLRMLAEVNEAYHTTIVMITHNEGIAQMADRVVRIHDGQIISNLKQQKKKVEELEI